MDANASLTFFAIMIALSAYVATLRWIIITRIRKSGKKVEKEKLKKSLRPIAYADIPLVISALLLFVHIFLINLIGITAPDFVFTWSVWLFTISFLALIVSHIKEWRKTF